jgi:hypothetical protein
MDFSCHWPIMGQNEIAGLSLGQAQGTATAERGTDTWTITVTLQQVSDRNIK